MQGGWRLAATLAAAPVLLAACQHKADDPVAASPDEQVQLNDAAAALDANATTATRDDDANAKAP